MSAPTTNIDTQVSRHRTPIWGIIAAIAFGAAMGAAIMYTATDTDNPETAAVQIDGRTGDVVAVD